MYKSDSETLHEKLQAAANGGGVIDLLNFLAALKDKLTSAELMQLVNEPNETGERPLHLTVCLQNEQDLIQQLLELGADPTHRTHSNQSILHYAVASFRNINNIRYILSYQLCAPLLDSVDDDLQSPLHVAASKSRLEAVIYLLERGADPNRRDKVGNTPLHLAAIRYALTPGSAEQRIIRALLEYANPAITNDQQLTPIQLMQQMGVTLEDESLKLILTAVSQEGPLVPLRKDITAIQDEPKDNWFHNILGKFLDWTGIDWQQSEEINPTISPPSRFQRQFLSEEQQSKHKELFDYSIAKFVAMIKLPWEENKILFIKYQDYLKVLDEHNSRFNILYDRYNEVYDLVFSDHWDKWLTLPHHHTLSDDVIFIKKVMNEFETQLESIRKPLNELILQKKLLKGSTFRDINSEEEKTLDITTASDNQLKQAFGQDYKNIRKLNSVEQDEMIQKIEIKIQKLNQDEQLVTARLSFYNEIIKRIEFIMTLRNLLSLVAEKREGLTIIEQLLHDKRGQNFSKLVAITEELFYSCFPVVPSENEIADISFYHSMYNYLDYWRQPENQIDIKKIIAEASIFYNYYLKLIHRKNAVEYLEFDLSQTSDVTSFENYDNNSETVSTPQEALRSTYYQLNSQFAGQQETNNLEPELYLDNNQPVETSPTETPSPLHDTKRDPDSDSHENLEAENVYSSLHS